MAVVNPVGGSGDPRRDTWVTPLWLADVISGDYEVDLDPCSNPRSHILAKDAVSLEHGGDGLFRAGEALTEGFWTQGGIIIKATADTRTFINPGYSRGQVIRWVRHYRHTDFIYLLRWAPDTEWFAELWPHCWGAWFPRKCEANPSGRINFEPPPGVATSNNPFPHALYLRTQPSGKFLDRLLAHGYLVRNDRQGTTEPNRRANEPAPAAAGGGGPNGAGTPATSGFAGIDRTAIATPRNVAWTDTGISAYIPATAAAPSRPTTRVRAFRLEDEFPEPIPAAVGCTCEDCERARANGRSEGEDVPF